MCYLSRLFQYHTTTSYSHTHARTQAHPFNGPFSGWASTRKVKPSWILLKQRDSEWQWHQLDHMQVCTLLHTDNHASTSLLSFLQAGYPSCHPTTSVKALKANTSYSCKLIMQKNDANLFPSVLWYTIGWVSGRAPSPQKLLHWSP